MDPRGYHRVDDEAGEGWLNAIFVLEILQVLFFIALGIATLVLDLHQIYALLFYTVHLFLFDRIFEMFRLYWTRDQHKPYSRLRALENLGRTTGAFLLLVGDVFSLTAVILERSVFLNESLWIATVAFWSIAILSMISFLGVTAVYANHQLQQRKTD
jgi:hypothetical protein